MSVSSNFLSKEAIEFINHLPLPKEENPAYTGSRSNSTYLYLSKLPLGRSFNSVPELSFLPSYEDPADLSSPRSNLTSASIFSLGSSLISVSELSFWSSATSLSQLSYYSFQNEGNLANSPPRCDFISVSNLSFSPSWDSKTTISQQPSSHEIRGSLGDDRMPVVYSPPDEDQITENEYTKEEKDTNLAQMKATSSSLPDLCEKQLPHLKSSASCRSSGYSSLHFFLMESKLTPPSTLFSKPQNSPSNTSSQNKENIPLSQGPVGDKRKRKKKGNRLKRFCAALKSTFCGCIFNE